MKEPVQMPLQASACEIEKITLPQIVSIKQASEIMNLPPYYLRRVCRETRIWHFNPGSSGTLTLASWRPTTTIKRSNRNNGIGKLMIPKRNAPYYVLTANVTVHGKGCGDMGALTLTPLY